MSDQSNEEILERIDNAIRDKDSLQHIKLKHPPRVFINMMGGDRTDPHGKDWCYNAFTQRTNTIQKEYLSLSEHQEIVKETVENETARCIAIAAKQLEEKDAEIERLKSNLYLSPEEKQKITEAMKTRYGIEMPGDFAVKLMNEIEQLKRECISLGRVAQKGVYLTNEEYAALKSNLARAVEALETIAKIKYGLDLNDSDEEKREYWARRAIWYQKIAQETIDEIRAPKENEKT